MSRSLKKGIFVDERLLAKIGKSDTSTVINTWKRASTISPEMIGYSIGVHNGKEHIIVKVNEEMVGHKLGEFAPTRKFKRHGGKMAKEQDKKGTK
jgi:small subunit ribosomal protein S19